MIHRETAIRQFRDLRQLGELLGGSFVGGVVFYIGNRSYTYDDHLHVLPIDRLWHEPTGPAARP